jgi:membrane protease YdiL (CAAX protease family)
LVTREGWGNLWLRPNFKRGWRIYLTAWLLPLLATIVGGGLFFLLFPGSLDPNLNQVRSAFAAIPALASQPRLAMLIIFFQVMIISMIINVIASLGEELGWRGYLLQKLMVFFAGSDGTAEGVTARPNAGGRRAAILIGLIWGVWHYPLFFLASTLTFPFVIIYVLNTIAASVLLSWVALRSGSVWPASIGHGMLNGTSAFPVLLANTSTNSLFGPGPTGLVGMAGYVILALVLLFKPNVFAGRKERLSEGA